MNVTIDSGALSGEIASIPSKSAAHRALICAALAAEPTEIFLPISNADIEITAREIQKLKKELYTIIADHSHTDFDKVWADSDRDYWMKAEEFRQRWNWAGYMAGQIASVLVEGKWDALPQIMVKLLPRFSDIKITKVKTKSNEWIGSYTRLSEEKSSQNKPIQ